FKLNNFFFFSSRRRHTRFSRDWSSDVCSSDLQSLLREILEEKYVSLFAQLETFNDIRRTIAEPFGLPINPNVGDQFPQRFIYPRSEERRVGKECRSKWSPER